MNRPESKSNYGGLTLTKLAEAVAKFFYKPTPLVPSLESRVLTGYAYSIANGKAHTGSGGVLLYIQACRKSYIPDLQIAQSIIVFTDDGPATLDTVTVTKRKTL